MLRPVLDNLRNDRLLLSLNPGRQMLVEGVVVRRPVASDGGVRLQIRPEHVFDGDTGRISLSGDILLRLGEGGLHITTGDRVRFKGKLKAPRNFGTPGEFDSERYLALRRVSATSFVKSEKDLLLMGRTHETRLQGYFDKAAIKTGEFIASRVPGANGAIIKALLIGDSGDIPQELQDAYSRTGVNHILSISGFHVGIIALALFQFWFALSRLAPSLLIYLNFRRVACAVSLPMVLYYLFLSGAAPATSRSVLMLGFVAVGMLLERETDHFNSLLLAASLLLLMDPASLYDISFQLSFIALWGIIVLTPVFGSLLATENATGRRMSMFFSMSLAAVLATLVPVAYYFQQATLAGLVSNFIIVPLLGYGAVVTGFAALPMIWIFPAAAEWLLLVAAELVKISNWFILQFDRLPMLLSFLPSRLDMALLLAGLLSITLVVSVRKKLWIVAAVAMLMLALHTPLRQPQSGLLRIDFLSVGQGESTLITFRDRKRMLIDGGGALQENGWDVGKRLLIPALRSMGVDRIDYLVLSHPHPDHLQGVRSVAEMLPVGEFWETGLISASDDYRRLKEALGRRKVAVRTMNAGISPVEISGVRFAFLAPSPTPYWDDANESSMVLRLDAGEFSALFTGDIGVFEEKRLLESPEMLGATLLKVPHHGSRHSVLPEFFRAVSPRNALIGAGYGNSFGLPSSEALEELSGLGCGIYRTDLDGTVTIAVTGNGENHVISAVNRHFH